MSLPPLAHVPQSLLDPFDKVQSITDGWMVHKRHTLDQLNPMDCLDTRIQLQSTLALCRSTMEHVHTTANHAVANLSEQRKAAISARLAKLNRDWYTSHLDADIDSYERADLSFDPPDLISEEELRAAITIPNDLEAFNKLTPREIMTKRFNAEAVERARAKVKIDRQERARKTHLDELLKKLDREDKWAEEALKRIDLWGATAKSYEIDLQAIAASRATAKAKALDPNSLDDQATESDQESQVDVQSEADDTATAGGESVVDVVMNDVALGDTGKEDEVQSGRSTPDTVDVDMSEAGLLATEEEEEEEEGALM